MEYTIVVDTREQRPLFTKNVSARKLEVGDYSIDGYTEQFAIERKSLSDLFGTLGKGHKRFKKELERAQSYEYFAIVIDGTYSQALNKEFDGSYHSRMRGYVITSILFTLHMKYNINFFFTTGRVESKKVIKELMKAYLKTKGI